MLTTVGTMLSGLRKLLAEHETIRLLDNKLLGRYREKQGDWAYVRELYLQGLELEPMHESLSQRLMVCHREMGERTEFDYVNH